MPSDIYSHDFDELFPLIRFALLGSLTPTFKFNFVYCQGAAPAIPEKDEDGDEDVSQFGSRLITFKICRLEGMAACMITHKKHLFLPPRRVSKFHFYYFLFEKI